MDANLQAGQEAPSAPVVIPKEGSKEYSEWRMTGKLPDAKGKPVKDATENTSDSESDDKSEQKSAPASEAGKDTQEKTKSRSTAQTRLEEILADLKHAGLSPAELKTFKREAKAELAKESPEQPVKPPERPKRPKQSEFYDQDDPEAAYEAAMDEYESKVREFDRKETIEEIKRTSAEEKTQSELQAQLNSAKERYGDEIGSVIISTNKEILDDPKIPLAVKAMINRSSVLIDLLRVIGSKPDELRKFIDLARSDPGEAIEQIVETQRLVKEELQKISKGNDKEEKPEPEEVVEESPRDGNGKFVSPKKITKAPPVPEEVGGNKGTPPDEADSAFKARNFEAFRAAQNRKDLARIKGV
jgi:hypothetical protein